VIKVLHTADLHLDTPFSAMNDVQKARTRRLELREAFGKTVDQARLRDVSVVLLAGDMLDNALSSGASFRSLCGRMRAAEDIKFFVAPGNHDFYSPLSPWRLMELPGNVHVFTGGIERVDLDGGVSVYGAAFTGEYRDEPVLEGFTVDDPQRINIMVLHGEVTTSPSRYNPITPEMIEKSGLDYLALGHVHAFSGLMRHGGTFWCYPGTPEPRGFDETGEKGAVIAKIDKGKVDLEFIPIAKRRYVELDADAGGLSSEEEIRELVRRTLENVSADDIVRVYLRGRVPPELKVSEGDIESAFDDRFYLRVIDALRPDEDIDSIALEQSLRGAFVRNIMRRMETADEEQRDMLTDALACGLAALSGEEIAL